MGLFINRLATAAASILVAVSAAHGDAASGDGVPPFGGNVELRGNLAASRRAFERSKTGRVAFMGGSITEMEGFRPMVCEMLRSQYPDTAFQFINAGIASTCSTTGAFRIEPDVLAGGRVDLLFVEFAVNDDQDAMHTRAECIRGMEGIVRHALATNPQMDIVFTYFVNEGMLATLGAGKIPLTIEAHEAVAKHYGIPVVNLANEVAEEIRSGRLTWAQYGGVHPAPFGNAICARMITELFSRAAAAPDASTEAGRLPEEIDRFNYAHGHFIDPGAAKPGAGWTLGVPDWGSLAGAKRSRFTSIPMLSGTTPDASAALEFEGTAVGAYVVAGPDAGIVEASVDGEPPREIDLYHPFSSGLHYPRTVMFATELKPGRHTVSLRIANRTKSGGHAVRIIQFCVN